MDIATRTSTIADTMTSRTANLCPNRPGNDRSSVPGGKGGTTYLGAGLDTGEQSWLSEAETLGGLLVLGAPGSGRTQTLLTLVANAMTWTAGCVFVAGSGDVAVFGKIFALARRFGREDDILAINLLDPSGTWEPGTLRSNSTDLFSRASGEGMARMVEAILEDDPIRKPSGILLAKALMGALAFLRDRRGIELEADTVKEWASFGRLAGLIDREDYPDMPDGIRDDLRAYLAGLPGYDAEAGADQFEETLSRHASTRGIMVRCLERLFDQYGHVFAKDGDQVDFAEALANRRILVVLLPGLDRTTEELRNLGRLVAACVEDGLERSGLGSRLSAPDPGMPGLIVLDGVTGYAHPGLGSLASKAKTMGIPTAFSDQDLSRLDGNDADKGLLLSVENLLVHGLDDDGTARDVLAAVGIAAGAPPRAEPHELKGRQPGEITLLSKDRAERIKAPFIEPTKEIDVRDLRLRTNHLVEVRDRSAKATEGAK